MISKYYLLDEFKRIGIQEGDTLFLRISFKSLGKIEEGPETVVRALRECVGQNGNLIVTAYGGENMSPYIYKRIFQSKVIFNKGKIQNIETGIIPVTIAKEPDSLWSSHPNFPYIVVGKDALEITGNHTHDSGPYDLLLNICENYNAKTLRIGGPILTGTTHISFTEAMIDSHSTQRIPKSIRYYHDDKGELKLQKSRQAAFCFDGYNFFFKRNILPIKEAILFHGEFLETELTLMSMKKVLYLERMFLNGHPELLLCENPDCLYCPHTFSYSKHKVDYLKIRVKRLLNRDWKAKIRAVKDMKGYIRDLLFIRSNVQ